MLRFVSVFGDKTPLFLCEREDQYDGEFGTEAILSRSEELRRRCEYEFSQKLQKRLRSQPSNPLWLSEEDPLASFEASLDEGDFGAAWLALNSPRAGSMDTGPALKRLASASRDPEFAQLADAWSRWHVG